MDDSIYRLRAHDILTLCVLGLLFLGCLMVQSASMHVTGFVGWFWTPEGIKQLLFTGAAVLAFFVVGKLDYTLMLRGTGRVWSNPILWLGVITGVSCLLVLIPHIGKEVNGARRWLPLGPLQLQPSELAKWSAVCFLAWVLTFRPIDLSRFRGFITTLVPVATLALLVVIQDFGTAALIAVVALFMMLAGGVKIKHLLIVLPPVLLAGFWFVYHKEYRWRRMTSFLDPWQDPQGEGYHMVQSLLSFASGGIGGRGLGNGVQKLGYLPEDTTDFVFAVVSEELGLFGAMLVVLLYLGIIFAAWQIIAQKRDAFGKLLAFGIGAMVGTQAVINMAVATVSVPTKGLSLPLISAGGSGLIITGGALGLLYSVATHRYRDEVLDGLQSTVDGKKDRPTHKPKAVTENVWNEWTT